LRLDGEARSAAQPGDPYRRRCRQGDSTAGTGGDEGLPLRVAVRPGGCSGYSYEMFFDSELAEDDIVRTFGVCAAWSSTPESAELIKGAVLMRTATACRRPGSHHQPQRHSNLRLRSSFS